MTILYKKLIDFTSRKRENDDDGIYLTNNKVNNEIIGNRIEGNGDKGILLEYSANYNNITGNMIIGHIDDGISINYNSNNNTIFKNNISSNIDDGIQLYSSCNDNILVENIIENNLERGIQIQINSNNNEIYHNNLINNTQNAYDESTNTWDDGYPSGGNYWDDYTGTDGDGDGIGDTPYDIPGGNNQDLYPLGYFNPIANYTYTPPNPTTADIIYFTDTSTDSDGIIVNWTWDFDDGEINYLQNPTHQYTSYGTYIVNLTVRDDDGDTDSIEKTIIVIAAEIVDQEQTQHDYDYAIYSILGSRYGGQSFKPTLETLNKVDLLVDKTGNPSDDLVVSIRDSLTGSDLTSVSLSYSDIPSTSGWVEFDFPNISITPDNTYYIVMGTSGGSTLDCYNWGYGYDTPYTDGAYQSGRQTIRGVTWRENILYDFCFKTYGI